ncbi:hypothetical protein DERF_004194 [Dermatophagoides farinae]|uniref:Secreted protein n=1 Tax=Dermatophagoides farinae TaxID=6954 RepID=A0A922I3B5_DERFA|nr:hypothetical protein DERF_004194 [Dermatophagoides farinae]
MISSISGMSSWLLLSSCGGAACWNSGKVVPLLPVGSISMSGTDAGSESIWLVVVTDMAGVEGDEQSNIRSLNLQSSNMNE